MSVETGRKGPFHPFFPSKTEQASCNVTSRLGNLAYLISLREAVN